MTCWTCPKSKEASSPLLHEPFNFKISLQGVINLIQPQALERGLDFEVSLSGVDEEELLGDALRLNQILINILSNALKFTPVRGLYTAGGTPAPQKEQ